MCSSTRNNPGSLYDNPAALDGDNSSTTQDGYSIPYVYDDTVDIRAANYTALQSVKPGK